MKFSNLVLSAAVLSAGVFTANVSLGQSVTQYGEWTEFRGTSKLKVNSYGKTRETTVTDSQALQLNGTGSQNKGDIHFRNGDFSSSYWSAGQQSSKTPGSVSGLFENRTSVVQSTGGFNSRLVDTREFSGSSDTFRSGL